MRKILKRLIKSFTIPFFLVLFSLPAVVGIAGPGFYSLHDDMHVAWLYEMDRALRSGQIPPRWAPDLSFGFGYPLFNFVYPLPFYLGEIFYILGFSLVGSIKMVFALSLLLSAPAMYVFLRRNFGKLFSFLGAILYIYTPYRAVDVYVRGAIGEALAFVFIPLVFWSFDKLIKDGGRKNITLSGICLALLILVHNIAFLMTIPLLIFYIVILLKKFKIKKQSFFNILSGFILGFAISLFFWLPAFWEKRLMVQDTVFNFWDHFPFITQLVFPSWGYGISIWGPRDEMSFQIGIANLVVILIALLIFLRFSFKRSFKTRPFDLFIWAFASLAFVLFLMNIRSSFIWERIPLLPYFQFPWRFLILTTFLTAFLAGAIDNMRFRSKWKNIIALILLVSAPVLTINYFKPEKIFLERTDTYYMDRYFANKTKDGFKNDVSSEYLKNTEEYLRLSLGTEKRPGHVSKQKIEILDGEIAAIEKSPVDYTAEVKADSPTQVILHNYYFPGWKAWIDSKEAEIKVNKPYGDMLINLPKGEHNINFKFTETNFRSFANIFSFLSLLTALFLLFLPRKKLNERKA